MDEASDITSELESLIEPGHRERLLARGLARGLIWQDGRLPPDAPPFSSELTTDLLDHGFHILALALRLRQLTPTNALVKRALHISGEAIESAVRRGRPANRERGFNFVMAAAAFHIGGYAARAYSLLEGDLGRLNLSSPEATLAALMRRDLGRSRRITGGWLLDPANSDGAAVARLGEGSDFDVDDLVTLSLTRTFHRAIANFDFAVTSASAEHVRMALNLLNRGMGAAGHAHHVPLWWAFCVARHLLEDLWGHSLHVRLPDPPGDSTWSDLRGRFIDLVTSRKIAELDLWPSQLEAATRIMDPGDDLVVALPTSAGKTRIAELGILRCLSHGKRAIYVTPLRALSAQVEAGLARTFRPLGFSVSAVYGASGIAIADVDTLRSAAIVVATPEKLDFAIRQDTALLDDVGLIVLDEGHMIGFSEREIHYEMLVQRLLRRADASQRRLICLSAVFTEGPTFDTFTAWLRSDDPGKAVRSLWRPTRQRPGVVEWGGQTARLELQVAGESPFVPRFITAQAPAIGTRQAPFPATDQELVIATVREFRRRGNTVLVYCPQRRSVESLAKQFIVAHRQGFFDSQLQDVGMVRTAQRIGTEWLGKDHPAVACLALGIGVHHGALPRPFLGEIEELLKQRQLPVAISSPTLAQGVDLSFSVLVFRSLIRSRDELIRPKEFANVVGRVGRAFVDLDGIYVLPIWELARRNTTRARFADLIKKSGERTLESGVLLLLRVLVSLLQSKLNCSIDDLIQYVLNQSGQWPSDETGEKTGIDVVLAELDTAILGIVDALDCQTSEVADRLDQALAGSYWKRRLVTLPLDLQRAEEAVLRGRAQWVWRNTTPAKRKGYFSAGVGVAAGQHIEAYSAGLQDALTKAEEALQAGDTDTAVAATVDLAEVLFQVHPFVPESGPPQEWQQLLGDWLRGRALAEFAKKGDAIEFIQNDVVFRLVWAVEAARVQLHALTEEEGEAPDGTLALCLTYGAPNIEAALLMQSGLKSRVVAVEAVMKGNAQFQDTAEMQAWLAAILSGEVPTFVWSDAKHEAEWQEFLASWQAAAGHEWVYVTKQVSPEWFSTELPETGMAVRIHLARDDVLVCDPEFVPLGRLPGAQLGSGHVCSATVADNGLLNVVVFGPTE